MCRDVPRRMDIARHYRVLARQRAGDGAAMNDEWRDISTAPKDGTSVLAYQGFEDGGHRMLTMIWSEKGGVWSWRADVHSFLPFEPTHWIPLPAPPKGTT